MKGNRFFKKRGKVGCLLVHGLTSSTQEFEELASYLYLKNYTVLATLLKGHNTSVKDLDKTDWRDWYSSIKKDFHILNKYCNRVYLIGSSVGATLCLHLATKTSKIEALVLLAPAIFYKSYLARLTPILKHFKKYAVKDYGKYYPDRKETFFDIADERALEKRIAYEKVPLSSIVSALDLIKNVKRELKEIDIPTLIIHSKKDHTIKHESAKYIYNNIKTHKKKLLYVKNSGHVLPVDFDKKKIFKEILNFIQK